MYSPKIDETLIPILYGLKKEIKKPMTHIVNEALKKYIAELKELSNDRDSIKNSRSSTESPKERE
jgi:hypothetical protein